MIIVSSADKPFMYTAKNTARRQAILRDYEPEIEGLYRTVDQSAQAELPLPQSWEIASAAAFVRLVVAKVLNTTLEDDDDMFRKGCDRFVFLIFYVGFGAVDVCLNSLQATWIRNSVLHAIRSTTQISTRHVSSNIVYENPTINELASFLSRLANSDDSTETDEDSEVSLMLNLVKKYSSSFPTHIADDNHFSPYPKDVVLLTGTTGAFGSTLLSELVKSSEVSLVYALNRKYGRSVYERQKATFQERDMDPSVLDSPKVVLLESDLDKDNLGLPGI